VAESVDLQKFNLRKENEVEGKEQYRIEISNRFAALEILGDNVNIIPSRTDFHLNNM
jgi:hypothetical protein